MTIINYPTLYPTLSEDEMVKRAVQHQVKPVSKSASDEDELVARLRKTDTDYYGGTSDDYNAGLQDGEEWARTKAEARHLRLLEKCWPGQQRARVAGEKADCEDVVRKITENRRGLNYLLIPANDSRADQYSREYTLGFFDAALNLWRSVSEAVDAHNPKQ